ncbi:MAG: hypothetical protein J5I98_09330 [Phaeodactylibacter sp.]|nr:hypothetical protein [Phaeodactylibacter sp.]
MPVLWLLAAGCSRKPAAGRENPPGEDSVAVDSSPPRPGVLTAQDSLLLPRTEPRLLASLKRTACYGRCPVYEVQFYSNGQAIYQGERNVPLHGIYLAFVSDSTINLILEKAYDIGFFGLSDFYPENGEPIADLPQSTTYLNDGRQEKTIVNNHLAPVGLLSFERFLDELAREVAWQPKVE